MDYFDLLVCQDDCIGGGYFEGLFEVWLNFYCCFVIVMDVVDCCDEVLLVDFWYLDVCVGVFGVCWVENCVCFVDNGVCWVDFC